MPVVVILLFPTELISVCLGELIVVNDVSVEGINTTLSNDLSLTGGTIYNPPPRNDEPSPHDAVFRGEVTVRSADLFHITLSNLRTLIDDYVHKS